MTKHEKLKNLFCCSTKELTQDGFLVWLLHNYDDTICKPLVHSLLQTFCRSDKEANSALLADEKIIKLTTWKQWRSIDIWIEFETDYGNKFAVILEDKTYSSEHKQLINYDKIICNHYSNKKDFTIFRVFYKTNLLSQTDNKGIDAANAKLAELVEIPQDKRHTACNGWQKLDIHSIVAIFEPYKNCGNIIIEQYTAYIQAIQKALENREKPECNDDQIDYIKWWAYFEHVVKSLQQKHTQQELPLHYIVKRAGDGMYPYMCLQLKKRVHLSNDNENKTEETIPDIPYLEIRSNDCTENYFTARILCYGVPDEELEKKQQPLIEAIRQNLDKYNLKQDNVRTRHKGKTIYPKQIGYTEKRKNITTDADFIDLVAKYAKIYLDLMQAWQ